MSKQHSTYDMSLLDQSWSKWRKSASLRAYYQSIYQPLLENRVPGKSLEIGSGCGFIKEFATDVETSDVTDSEYIDRVISAYALDQLDTKWDNLLAVDVLHHLEEPFRFFSSASQALNSGGRILLCEPAGTFGGRCFYKLFHHEPCSPTDIQPPYSFNKDTDGLFANMGMGHALFHRDKIRVAELLQDAGFKIHSVSYRDIFAYPLTGGFSKPAMLPAFALRGLLAMERIIPQFILRAIGLRMTIILEKQ